MHKTCAGYDPNNDKFGSPSIVLKIKRALKQCCDIAEFNISKITNTWFLKNLKEIFKHCSTRDKLLKNCGLTKFVPMRRKRDVPKKICFGRTYK